MRSGPGIYLDWPVSVNIFCKLRDNEIFRGDPDKSSSELSFDSADVDPSKPYYKSKQRPWVRI